MDLPRYAALLGSTVLSGVLSQRNPQAAAQAPKAENMKPSFGGLAIRLTQGRAFGDGWVPGTAVGEIYKAYKPVFEGANHP